LGFSGGGSNVLLPHTHDGTVAQDGGPLDFDNVTQADLTAGDVVFSDGTHLQRLAIGTPAQQIKVNAGATAPEYFTPAAASSTVTLIDSTELGAPAADIDTTYAAVSFADVSCIDIYWSANQTVNNDFRLRFNGLTGGVYNYQWSRTMGGAQTIGQISAGTEVFHMPNTDYGSGHCRLICHDPSSAANQYMMFEGSMVGITTNTLFEFGGYISTNPINSSDGVRLYCPGSNLNTGAVMSIYSTSRT